MGDHHGGYPRGNELGSYLEGAGISPGAGLNLDTLIGAARRDFERAVGGIILAAQEPQERRFDPPFARWPALLDLGDFLLEPASVAYQRPDGDPQSYTIDEDVWFRPDNAAERGRPFELLEFLRPWPHFSRHGDRRSIRVTGRWGYADSVPDDVFDAILARAAWRAASPVRHAETGGMAAIHQADVKLQFGVESFGNIVDGWGRVFEETVASYQRLSIG